MDFNLSRCNQRKQSNATELRPKREKHDVRGIEMHGNAGKLGTKFATHTHGRNITP